MTDMPSTAMPEEAPQIGDGSALSAQRKRLESVGSPARGGASVISPGASPSPPQAPQQGPPVQPPPRQPLTQADMQPGGPVFMQPRTQAAPSWRQQLRVWAEHPEANAIRRLSKRADAGMQTGQPPQPGQ